MMRAINKLPWLLTCLILSVTVFSGCPNSGSGGSLNGMGGDDDDLSPTPECPFGFVMAQDGACNCPEGNVTIGDVECFELPINYLYADKQGCQNTLGLAILLPEENGFYDDVLDATLYDMEYIVPHHRSEALRTQPANYRRKNLANGRDSIWFVISEPEYDRDSVTGERRLGRMYFAGTINRTEPLELKGTIIYGKGSDTTREPDIELGRCDVVFNQ